MKKETSKERVKKMAADLAAETADTRIKVVEMIADNGFGGGEVHVLGLLNHLDQKKFELFLICSPGVLANRAREIEGVKVFEVEFRSKFDFSARFKIEHVLSEIQTVDNPFRPMIVHTHGPRAGYIGRKATPRGVYKVYTEHVWTDSYHLENRINEWAQKRALGALNFKTDAVIAVSSAVKKFLVSNNLAAEKRVFLIPNGIDSKSFQLSLGSLQAKHGHQPPVIGTIGNLNLQKGQQYLIEAMPQVLKKYPHATLEIIGEGEERSNLKSQISKIKIDRHVTLLGRKEHPEQYLRKWDVFALPSVSETFGITILEAMAMGIPVVAANVGGVIDIVKNKKNGILVNAKSVSGFASAILEILDHPVEAAKMVREGRETAQTFDWSNIIKQIEKLYQNLAREKF